MPTITTVDATWDTDVAMDAAELRRADSAMFLGDGSANGVRGGIVRHGDTSLAVTVNGSDQVTVQAGAFVVPAATGLGVYRGALAAATAATAISARNATNPRIDLVVVQVTGTNATVKTIDGTPGASPSAPALPAQHIELARITVPATGGGAVTVDSTWRAYATGLGGTLLVETSARLPGSGNHKGQRAVAFDTGAAYRWNGTAWTGDVPIEVVRNRFTATTWLIDSPTAYGVVQDATERAALQSTLTKVSAATGLVVTIAGTAENSSGIAQVLYLGIQINGTNYPVARNYWAQAPSRNTWAGVVRIEDIAAGSVSLEPVLASETACLIRLNAGQDSISYSVREVA